MPSGGEQTKKDFQEMLANRERSRPGGAWAPGGGCPAQRQEEGLSGATVLRRVVAPSECLRIDKHVDSEANQNKAIMNSGKTA